MPEGERDMPRKMRGWKILSLFILAVLLSAGAAGEEAFSVKRVGNLIPFNDNSFTVYAPESGKLTIRIHDDISVYRTIEEEIPAGETTIHWDGCAYNHEKLATKNYTITAELKALSGKEYSVSFNTPVEYTGQCLQYMLPSSGVVSLAEAEEWFVEFRTVQKGTVTFIFHETDGAPEDTVYSVNTTGGRINRVTWDRLTKKKPLQAGNYRVTAYENTKEEEAYRFSVRVQEEPAEKREIFITGGILAEEGMTEEEIWEKMQQPSVVVDIDNFKHQKVYARKDPKSESLGTLHGQTQALEVIQIEGEWALVGAWNHEEAEYVEGWVPVSVLKVSEPDTEYGILINKKKQTLELFHRGKRIDTLEVSTGRAEEKHPEQETAAGSFLTGYHRVDFSMNGKKYDYVIQYDGGNLLHQIPYEWGKDKKDFSAGRSYLGAKASHACIRMQAEPAENGTNAYWIWTHIPYHTRVMILDDPEERRPVSERPGMTDGIGGEGEDQIRITLRDEKWDENATDSCVTEEIKGRRIGIAKCGEKEYIRNPGVVGERIAELKEKGCEKILLKCYWSSETDEGRHTAMQEAMARKGVKAGADLVIGNGSRKMLGGEWQGKALILYGLGDEKRAGKRPWATAEVIFDMNEKENRPAVVLLPGDENADTEQMIRQFTDDSIGAGIGEILFMAGDQS